MECIWKESEGVVDVQFSQNDGKENKELHVCDELPSVFTARRCASAVYAVVMRPSIRLSQAGVVSKPLNALSLYLAWRLPSTYPTLGCKEICISPK